MLVDRDMVQLDQDFPVSQESKKHQIGCMIVDISIEFFIIYFFTTPSTYQN